MVVIYKQTVSVYNYVYPCYKVEAQILVYINVIHPMQMTTVSDGVGVVIGGQDLDDAHNRHILPPTNPHSSGQLRVKRGNDKDKI